MSSSFPSNIQAARETVASRLKEIRLDAGLTGTELAFRCGWHKSKSSRIENAKTPPSDEDIRTWCRACTAEGQTVDLIAASRNAESLYVEWRRKQRSGLRQLQESYVPLYEKTELFRFYTPDMIPGSIQTPEYTRELFKRVIEFNGMNDDFEAATKARMERSTVLRQGNHRFAIILEEAALQYRFGDRETMADQLSHLFSAMSLPNVSLGIIPSTSYRSIWPMAGFYIFDDHLVRSELATAELTINSPTEVATHIKAFNRLQKLAVYGPKARTLITSAIEALD